MVRRMWVPMLCAAMATGTLVAVAAADTISESNTPSLLETRGSRSLGWPWRGRLVGSTKLEPSALLRFADGDVARGHFYGTSELVGMISRAVSTVDTELPGARLTVGELSRQRGGDIVGHRSHENGRDVDVGFYFRDEAGVPVETPHFLFVSWRGLAKLDEQIVHFDDARNWSLVRAMIQDPEANIQHVFTALRIRRRLLKEAKRQEEPAELIEQAKKIIIPANVSHPHHNHFHVRIYCPADDLPVCRDRGPYWPWLPEDHPFRALAWPRPAPEQ